MIEQNYNHIVAEEAEDTEDTVAAAVVSVAERRHTVTRPMGIRGLMSSLRSLVLLSVMLLSACSADSPILEPEQPTEEDVTPITLGGTMPEATAVTRTATPLSSSTNTFKVWAYKNNGPSNDPYYSNQTVMAGYRTFWQDGTAGTTSSNTNNWDYVGKETGGDPTQYIKYWDFSARAYRYMAYAPADATVSTVVGSGTADISFSFAVDATDATKIAETPYFSRLWFSDGTYGQPAWGEPVQLEFLKPYVRVRFMFTQSDPDADFVLTNIRFKPVSGNNIARKGTFSVTYPLLGDATTYTFATSGIDAASAIDDLTHPYVATTDEFWYTLLPAAAQGAYEMSLKINGEDRTATVPAEYMVWEPNHLYTYVFKITEEGGVIMDQVSVAFKPWSEIEIDYEVFNW